MNERLAFDFLHRYGIDTVRLKPYNDEPEDVVEPDPDEPDSYGGEDEDDYTPTEANNFNPERDGE